MKLKISIRLTLWYMLASTIIMFSVSAAMYWLYEKQSRKAIDDDLVEYADFLISDLNKDSTDLDAMFYELLEKEEIPLSVLKSHKFFLTSVDSIIFEENSIKDIRNILIIYNQRESFNKKFFTIKYNNIDYRLYSTPIRLNDGNHYKLNVITSLDKFNESLIQLFISIAIFVPIAILISGIIGFIIARKAFEPVIRLTDTAASIRYNKLNKRVPIKQSNDELNLLAQTFNDMIDRLEKAFKSQQRFIADASHDIRTPITIVLLELELLLQNNLPIEVELTINKCINELQNLNKLTQDLLILTRYDSKMLIPKPHFFKFDELIYECIDSVNSLANNKNIDIKFQIDGQTEVYADKALIKRAIFNLLDNAIKFSKEDNVISIKLYEFKNDIMFRIYNESDSIDKDKLQDLFRRFHRADLSRSGSGFGLGLSIVQAIIESHNSKISVDAMENGGITFTFGLRKYKSLY